MQLKSVCLYFTQHQPRDLISLFSRNLFFHSTCQCPLVTTAQNLSLLWIIWLQVTTTTKQIKELLQIIVFFFLNKTKSLEVGIAFQCSYSMAMTMTMTKAQALSTSAQWNLVFWHFIFVACRHGYKLATVSWGLSPFFKQNKEEKPKGQKAGPTVWPFLLRNKINFLLFFTGRTELMATSDQSTAKIHEKSISI